MLFQRRGRRCYATPALGAFVARSLDASTSGGDGDGDGDHGDEAAMSSGGGFERSIARLLRPMHSSDDDDDDGDDSTADTESLAGGAARSTKRRRHHHHHDDRNGRGSASPQRALLLSAWRMSDHAPLVLGSGSDAGSTGAGSDATCWSHALPALAPRQFAKKRLATEQ